MATILLIAMHKTARASILSSSSPTGLLAGVDPVVYGKVKDYMTTYPQAVEPVLMAFQAAVQDLTLYSTGTDDGGYTGPPEGCLSSANMALIQAALKTVQQA